MYEILYAVGFPTWPNRETQVIPTTKSSGWLQSCLLLSQESH